MAYQSNYLIWQQLPSIPSSGRRGGICFNNSTTIYYTTGIDQTNNRLKETWKIINLTALDENRDVDEIIIYPNPANEFINININKFLMSVITAELIDSSGRIVKKEKQIIVFFR